MNYHDPRTSIVRIMNRCRLPALLLGICLGASCSTSPPSRSDDVCVIFQEKNGWYAATLASQSRWGTPVPVIMAFIRHESGFRADARPARRRILWIIPGPRPSDAYGYPQALDSTWRDYRRATGERWADRDDFADAADFIGWYNDLSHRSHGIAKTDAYNLYLAYHEGQGGYGRGTYHAKAWLLRAAQRIAATADNYRRQLQRCRYRF